MLLRNTRACFDLARVISQPFASPSVEFCCAEFCATEYADDVGLRRDALPLAGASPTTGEPAFRRGYQVSSSWVSRLDLCPVFGRALSSGCSSVPCFQCLVSASGRGAHIATAFSFRSGPPFRVSVLEIENHKNEPFGARQERLRRLVARYPALSLDKSKENHTESHRGNRDTLRDETRQNPAE